MDITNRMSGTKNHGPLADFWRTYALADPIWNMVSYLLVWNDEKQLFSLQLNAIMGWRFGKLLVSKIARAHCSAAGCV